MATVDSGAEAVRRQLERVLASASFTRNERQSRLLRFVVERHLEGRDDELKESVIALEVFGNRDYDPKQDSTVRTEAGRLRARLAGYYVGEGSGDPVVIELPKGGYIPVFRRVGAGAPRLRVRKLLVLATLGLAVAGAGWWWARHQSGPLTVAVLPLENLSHDPANEYFADGLTSEIIHNLSILDGLAVRSQSSSFVFKGKPQNLREAGKQLDVDYILEGSVLRAGERLRIIARLVRVRDDFPLWSVQYDRELTEVFAIQEDISRGIVNRLRLKLGRGRRRYETSTEAYDLYLRARALPIQQGMGGYKQSAGLFEEAIAKDPSFAPAYAGLAAAHAFRSGWFGRDSADEAARMRAAADKAIQLDPLLAEAHDSLGMASAHDAQWDQAEKSFRHAIELDRGSSTSYAHFAMFLLWPLGRLDEALQQLRIAEKADPLSPELQAHLALGLTAAGRFDEAAGICERLPADLQGKSECLCRARVGQGRVGEAIQIMEAALDRGIWRGSGCLGYAYARTGRREEAEKLAAANSRHPFYQAAVFAGLGDKDRTFEALERAVRLGPVRMSWELSYLPGRALLRGDPRLKALRRKVGLPE